jgi:hypothetical protein
MVENVNKGFGLSWGSQSWLQACLPHRGAIL